MNENVKQSLPITEEAEPDTSDIPELSEGDWACAEVGKFYRPKAKEDQH